jgi:peptidoglycan-N-acetylglucosamine deacetylase
MKSINLNLFPGGLPRAATFSYDDGVHQDKRLVEIFNKYGLKSTFHLNGGLFGNGNRISSDEIGIYDGHEISCHSLSHPTLTNINGESVVYQIVEDRKILEALTGQPIIGMSYPNGAYDSNVMAILKTCGIVYCRTVVSTGQFALPDDFLAWHPTCHHRDERIFDLIEGFTARDRFNVLYIWGHAYEFDRNEPRNNWEHIEDVCKRVSEIENCWFATNIEIYRYAAALKQLIFTIDGSVVTNPSATDLWINVDAQPVKIPAGETMSL